MPKLIQVVYLLFVFWALMTRCPWPLCCACGYQMFVLQHMGPYWRSCHCMVLHTCAKDHVQTMNNKSCTLYVLGLWETTAQKSSIGEHNLWHWIQKCVRLICSYDVHTCGVTACVYVYICAYNFDTLFSLPSLLWANELGLSQAITCPHLAPASSSRECSGDSLTPRAVDISRPG